MPQKKTDKERQARPYRSFKGYVKPALSFSLRHDFTQLGEAG